MTSNSYRTVALSADVVTSLRLFERRSGASPYLFVTGARLARILRKVQDGSWLSGTEPFRGLAADFKELQRRAGVRPHKKSGAYGRLHDLRGSYVCRLLDSKNPPSVDVIALQIGDTPETVLNFYVRDTLDQTSADKLRRATEIGRAPDAQQFG